MLVRNPFTYDSAAASNEAALTCEDPSLTQQHHKDDVDINEILRRFGVTGHLPETNNSPMYIDVSGTPDMMAALNRRAKFAGDFSHLPLEEQARYGYSPETFLNDSLEALQAASAAADAAAAAAAAVKPADGGDSK